MGRQIFKIQTRQLDLVQLYSLYLFEYILVGSRFQAMWIKVMEWIGASKLVIKYLLDAHSSNTIFSLTYLIIVFKHFDI